MHQVILGPREHHNVRDVGAYRATHAAMIARKAKLGHRIAVVESADPVPARIDFGSWVVDCPCGSGCATDVEWGVACCFGCGAVHVAVVFPPDVAEIERLILARPHMKNRQWIPTESVADVVLINRTHGVGV